MSGEPKRFNKDERLTIGILREAIEDLPEDTIIWVRTSVTEAHPLSPEDQVSSELPDGLVEVTTAIKGASSANIISHGMRGDIFMLNLTGGNFSYYVDYPEGVSIAIKEE